MLTRTAAPALSALPPVRSDSLLALIALAKAESRPEKIDVGVGVFRNGEGRTPVLGAIKAAERRLLEEQDSKGYLGGAGDVRFAELLRPLVLGAHAADERVAGVQAPGGTGAVYLALRLAAVANPEARVIMGVPTWPNHPALTHGAGLEIVEYPYYDRDQTQLNFPAMMDAFGAARPGDIALLHGCCHNPTGADLDEAGWRAVVDVVAERGLLPLIDIAYQGFGRGLDEDAVGVRLMLDACDEALVAQSCDKNFGMYRDRVGCFFLKTRSAESSATAMAHVLQIAREAWSMPPDHGAAAVRTVLEDAELTAEWQAELEEMRLRIATVRERIAASDERLAFIADQYGMFSMLPLSRARVVSLRERHAVYMADSGRFNVVGIADEAIDRFCAAVIETMDSPPANG
ncbi:MAG: Aspartate aminotransferase [uncultured Sphingomonas sp.]|uniref:Aspartate aminotransferase n=1 Tax=uncultured Sphingomonas sp. TaxID=158754 RepID=A0A6J4T8B8_9SPHN|nr:aromatic amino acid transaminase [uncultured Sphingomonas sp.]CAA9516096.1 MAG: Aspartate aminotransferase [uncultured Sphingomonas sp.]